MIQHLLRGFPLLGVTNQHIFVDKSFSWKLALHLKNSTIAAALSALRSPSPDMTDRVFHSCEKVLEFFKETPRVRNIPVVKELLQVYENKVKDLDKDAEKRHIFIVFEGLDGCGKTTQAEMLARHLDAHFYHTPPDYIDHMKETFQELGPLEKTAFYSLGNYMAAIDIKNYLHKRPVVLDRYWHSTTAYGMAQEIREKPNYYSLPENTTLIYRWPMDLLKPDAVLFLNVSEKTRITRHSLRSTVTKQEVILNRDKSYRENTINAYLAMKEPEPIVINGDQNKEEVFNEILKKLERFLKNHPKKY